MGKSSKSNDTVFIISNIFGKVYMKYNLIKANLSYYKVFENMPILKKKQSPLTLLQ